MSSAARLTTDLLILGTGGAGLMAALHAKWLDPSLGVTLVSKGLLGKSGCTRMVQGGYNVVLDPRDSVQAHFEDTVCGGGFLNDQDLAWTLCEDAPCIVRELENRIGCLFDRAPDGRIHQKAFAAQTFDRTVHVGDLTGIEIMARLRDHVLALGIPCLEETRALELLTTADGSTVCGAVLLDQRSGEFIEAHAKAVLLATGAGPLMYQRAACAQEKSCDGIAAAFRAGAHLMDMEMVQFHPTGMVVPGSRLNGALLEEGLRGAGARLFNGRGERYMEHYDPERKERSTRDRVSRAGFTEIAEGRGTANGAVWIDVAHLGAEFVEKNFAGMRERCLRLGVDIARERIEVAPTAHFNMGGVRINRDGFTNLSGLFAAGEDAAGVHGANRLGGNGVAESTVFGARAGEAAAKWCKSQSFAEPAGEQFESACQEALKLLGSQNAESPFSLRDELGKVMWERVGIIRSGEGLRRALAELAAMRVSVETLRVAGARAFNLAWQQALDLRNLVLSSELIARGALEREESRGAHFRLDFPHANDDAWLRNILHVLESGQQRPWTQAVRFDRLAPQGQQASADRRD
jgi:succinate dehydrogenase / fumarate reductase flavoprotein subunit/fumarate reductase flavoprotein subunit